MTTFNRPTPRINFLSLDKRIEVYFYTSSIEKFIQARIVFEKNGLILRHFKSKSDPYNEDYSCGKEVLLTQALAEVTKSFGMTSLCFVEDTSLRIEAMSTEKEDFPGLALKEWFASTNFDFVDLQLKKLGKNRNAIVKSDIGLHVPYLDRTLFFHGETEGVIADTAPTFSPSVPYPWLTPTTFNGWFIPKGATNRLGEMSLEESWRYDFRIKSLIKLVDRLEEYSVTLNAPPQMFSRKPTTIMSSQHSMFDEIGVPLIVVGRTCAGKTTFGDYASQKFNRKHIEASSIVRMLETEPSDLSAYDIAKTILEIKGPDIVAKTIVRYYSDVLNNNAIITGFRTIEELEYVRKIYPNAKIVLVESSLRTRFQRQISRARENNNQTIDAFKDSDEKQWRFGLLRVAESCADIEITNEGTVEEYFQQIDAVITNQRLDEIKGISRELKPKQKVENDQIIRSLSYLEKARRPLTNEEMSLMSNTDGNLIRANNVNKVLKKVPEFALRIENKGEKIKYTITNTGISYLRFMKQRLNCE